MSIPYARAHLLRPDQMSPEERLAEVAGLLALAFLRLRSETPGAEAGEGGESSLDCLARQSGRVLPDPGARP